MDNTTIILMDRIKNLPSELQYEIYKYDDTYRNLYKIVMEQILPIHIRVIKKMFNEKPIDNYENCYLLSNEKKIIIFTLQEAYFECSKIILDSLTTYSYDYLKPYLRINLSENVYNELCDFADTTNFNNYLRNNLIDTEQFINDTLNESGVEEFLSIYGDTIYHLIDNTVVLVYILNN